MLTKVAHGFRVASVEVSTHHPAVPFSHAACGTALENVDTAILDILNRRHLLEEYVHR
jgi:hypothetical protein